MATCIPSKAWHYAMGLHHTENTDASVLRRSRLFSARVLIWFSTLTLLFPAQFAAAVDHSESKPQTIPDGAAPTGQWVVDPGDSGANIPPVGRSLFDYIVTIQRNGKYEYDVPYPYTKLIGKIEALVEKDSPAYSPVKQVLVPLGRSLARNIARPDFFRYPRVVAAVDTQPAWHKSNAGMLLKDRLYIGFGEKANILEVISYNEAAGRFEFQVVKDYKEGATPKVFYISREVCSACHQNGALIFSRQQWDETNANPQIAALLKFEERDYFGIPIDRGVDVPGAIDAATDRANYFALSQLLWRDACEPYGQNKPRPSNTAIQCRADILNYALQYKLSNNTYFDTDSDRYRNNFLPNFQRNWQQRWPSGLHIPDPNLPNRNPLIMFAGLDSLKTVSGKLSEDSRAVLNAMLSKNDVPQVFEPLNPRAPLETWHGDRESQLTSVITGISEFIADSDARRLDAQIYRSALNSETKTRVYSTDCEIYQRLTAGGANRIKFICEASQADAPTDARFAFRGLLYLNKEKLSQGTLTSFVFGKNQSIQDIKLSKKHLSRKNSVWNAELEPTHNNGMRVRGPDGNALQSISLRWTSSPDGQLQGRGTITVLEDYTILSDAIQTLVAQTEQETTDALADLPFRRGVIMASLFDNLHMPNMNWCCTNDAGMPPIVLDGQDNTTADPPPAQEPNPDVAPFYHYCSKCHRTQNSYPPNFLYGDKQQVESNITHCAERIYFRLSMWQIHEENRPKSPMPPITALGGLGLAPDTWAGSDALAELKHYVAGLIQSQHGLAPKIEEMIKRGFNELDTCLPTK